MERSRRVPPLWRPRLGAEADLIEPIWEYHHDVGKSITGGGVYRGQQFPELQGCYLHADYVSAKIWALRYDGAEKRVVAKPAHPRPQRPGHVIRRGRKGGNVFHDFFQHGAGIYRFVPAGAEKGKD